MMKVPRIVSDSKTRRTFPRKFSKSVTKSIINRVNASVSNRHGAAMNSDEFKVWLRSL